MHAARFALAALTATLAAACGDVDVRPGAFFSDDDAAREIVAFDDRLPLTFNTAVRTCMLTADQPTVRFAPGQAPALFDQCAPDLRSALPTFQGDDLTRFRGEMAAVPMSGKERNTVLFATPPLVAATQAERLAPLPDVGFSDRVTKRLNVLTERVFGYTVGHWYCDVGYSLDVDFNGVNLGDLQLGWAPPARDGETNQFALTFDFVDNRDVITGRGEASLSRCGFQVSNRWLRDRFGVGFSLPLPLRAAVGFSVDVEHLQITGLGRPRVIDAEAELLWTVEAQASGIRVHDTLLPYVSTLDTLLRWLPRAGVDAVGLAEQMVAEQMQDVFADQLGPQFEMLLNTATEKESGLLMGVHNANGDGPAFRYWR